MHVVVVGCVGDALVVKHGDKFVVPRMLSATSRHVDNR